MRVAVFSDIHGNLSGLRAVLQAIKRHGHMDAIVAAGDLIGGGPAVNEIIEELHAHQCLAVPGNSEEMVLKWAEVEHLIEGRWKQPVARIAEWTKGRLSTDSANWLRGLPTTLRYSPATGEDLLICHASPVSVWDKTCAPHNPESLLRETYGLEGVRLAAFGHYHGPHVKCLPGLTLANISCVSQIPDGIAAAHYSILTWTGEYWLINQHRAAFEIQREVEAIRRAEMPLDLAGMALPIRL